VNDDPADNEAWQWFGSMSVAPNGRIDAIWNDTRNDAGNFLSEVFYSFSVDGGETWSTNQAVTPPFDPSLGYPQQQKLGDYYHMISDNQGANLAYAATFNGEQDVYFLRIPVTSACDDGLDNDNDGLVDYPSDPGCTGVSDLAERDSSLPCDDGIDNDGDGRTDFDPDTFASPGDQYTLPSGSGDPGCFDSTWFTESPECQDGINNDPSQDFPGHIDYDAGYSVNGSPDPWGPDPECVGRPWMYSELRGSCGVGSELALLLPPLMWMWRRR
jgi:hypothetical protein